MLEELLAVLRARPRTLPELLLLLNASAGQVQSALLQLRRGGYVDRAVPDQGSCRSGCGHCSVKNFCPGTQAAEAEESWRLTDKALSRVAPLRKILVVHTAGGIGDVLLSTAVVGALHDAYPGCQVDFLCQSRTAGALRDNPQIHKRFEWPERRPKSFQSLIQWAMLLRGRRYDAGLVLWSNTQVAWLLFLAGIPVRVGQDSRLAYSFLYTHKVRVRSEHGDVDSHWSEILLDFVRALGVQPGPARVRLEIAQSHRDRAAQLLPGGAGPLIAFHPFKGPPVPLEHWPLPVFAGWLDAMRRDLGARIVVTGSPGEKPFADRIIELAGSENVLNLAGETDLATLAAVAQQVDVFVCPDSGPMHVAAAAGARVLGIYAMEEDFPRRWAPLTATARVLRPQPTGCPPGCRKPTCRDFRCYQSVTPERVVAEISGLLQQQNPRVAK